MYVYKITNTTQKLCNRMGGHRQHARKGIKTCSITKCMREKGIENFKIELISEHKNVTNRELLRFEQDEIDRTPPELLLNKNKAYYAEGEAAERQKAFTKEFHKNMTKEQKRTYHNNAYVSLKADPVRYQRHLAKEAERKQLRKAIKKEFLSLCAIEI
jgi:hypothetical protein